MTRDEFIDIGFKPLPHFTVSSSLEYCLSRNRSISVGNVGTCSELVWLCEHDENDYTNITDLINISNYDYDGNISKEKILQLIFVFEK